MTTNTKVIVDCSGKTRPVNTALVDRLRKEAADHAAHGRFEEAQTAALQASRAATPTGAVQVVALTAEETAQLEADRAGGVEHARADARALRNALLAQSDWTQLPDAPLTAPVRAEWVRYRQELRDHDFTDPAAGFPDPPGGGRG